MIWLGIEADGPVGPGGWPELVFGPTDPDCAAPQQPRAQTDRR